MTKSVLICAVLVLLGCRGSALMDARICAEDGGTPGVGLACETNHDCPQVTRITFIGYNPFCILGRCCAATYVANGCGSGVKTCLDCGCGEVFCSC